MIAERISTALRKIFGRCGACPKEDLSEAKQERDKREELRSYERLGREHGLKGDYDLAIEAFNKALEISPRKEDHYHELGNMYKMKGLYDEAISNYQKALAIKPERSVSIDGIRECRMRKRLREIESEKDYPKAVAALKKMIRQDGGNLEIYERLGHVYNLMGKYDLAIGAFKKVVEFNPEREEPYHELGNMYKMKGLYDEAISNYQKALDINPARDVSLSGIAFCMLKKGEHERAIEKFRETITVNPGDLDAYRNLLDIYISLGRYKDMKDSCEALRRSNMINKDARIKYLLIKAELFRKHKDSLKDGRDLKKVIEGISREAGIDSCTDGYGAEVLKLLTDDFLLQARRLRSQKKDHEALLRYKNVLSIDPDNEEGKKGLYFTEKFLHPSERPHFCAISIVFRCMMRCKMCRIWENKTTDELSVDSWKRVIDDLSGFMDENRTINFAGGEPLLKEDLIDLINHSAKKGFKPAICTNGWLIDEDMAKRLVDSGIDIVAVSLDSLNEKTHDYLRGVEGAYKRVMDAITYLDKHNKDRKIRVHVQPIISEVNLDDLIELTHWANRHKAIGDITFLAVIQPPHTKSDYQAWYKKREFKELWPKDKDKVDFVMDELIKLKTEHKTDSYKIGNQVFQLQAYKEYFRKPLRFYKKKVQCNIGTQFVNIHTNGDVKLCHYSDIIIGNVTRSRMKDIWHSKHAESAKDEIKLCRKKCHQILNCMKDENPYL